MTSLEEEAIVNLPLTGEGETVAIADSGIDTGDPDNIHEDFQGRIIGIKSWPVSLSLANMADNVGDDDGAADLDSGHGTHVAGSVLGNGSRSRKFGSKAILGLANRAGVFFQALEQEMKWKIPHHRDKYGIYYLAGIPDDLIVLFQQAYDAGAKIHTNPSCPIGHP